MPSRQTIAECRHVLCTSTSPYASLERRLDLHRSGGGAGDAAQSVGVAESARRPRARRNRRVPREHLLQLTLGDQSWKRRFDILEESQVGGPRPINARPLAVHTLRHRLWLRAAASAAAPAVYPRGRVDDEDTLALDASVHVGDRIFAPVAETCVEPAARRGLGVGRRGLVGRRADGRRRRLAEERGDLPQLPKLEHARSLAQLVPERVKRRGVSGGEDGAHWGAVAGGGVACNLEEKAPRAVDARRTEQASRREEHDDVPARVKVAQKLADARVDDGEVEGLPKVPADVARSEGSVNVEHNHLGVDVTEVRKRHRAHGAIACLINHLVSAFTKRAQGDEIA
mmetsp:Transcript_24441/g.53330  ORF Transcript_24441/g.53330 Transcript_24441/m.53330 type:complete len:342 (-) Transcript_24441:435-1460(-)